MAVAFRVYKLDIFGYIEAVTVYEDATVNGDHWLADNLRLIFNYAEDEGYDPTDYIDNTRRRIEENLAQAGYYHITNGS